MKPLWFRSMYLAITYHLCHSFHSVHMVSVSRFCHCYAAVSNFSCSMASVGFSSAAQWGFLLQDVLSGFFLLLHLWVFLLLQLSGFFFRGSVGFLRQDVLSGFFFCSSVGFSSAGCAQWFFLLQLSGFFFCRMCSMGLCTDQSSHL